MNDINTKTNVEINGVNFDWDLQRGSLTFFDIPSTLFWNDPSLLNMFKPLVEELGKEMFCLQVAYSSSLGTSEDYNSMVTNFAQTFDEGFINWGKAVSGAGWGVFELSYFDPKNIKAKVIIHNPWELSMQKNLGKSEQWGCPFLQGKIIGIFNHALKHTCWADETYFLDGNENRVEFDIYQHSDTIQDKIDSLRQLKEEEKVLKLRELIQVATTEKDKLLAKERILKNELEESELEKRNILSTLPDMIWLKDIDGIYQSCNPEFELFFGATENDIVGKTDYDFVGKELADFFRENDKKAMYADKPTINEEWITYATDRRRVLLETTKTPLKNKHNEIIGVLGIGHDITQIQLDKDRLNYALRGANDGFWDWNMDTNELYFSPRWLEMVGYKKGELLEVVKSWENLVHPDDIQETWATAQDYINGKTDSYETEFRMQHKQGYWVYILARGALVKDEEGNLSKPLRMVGTHVDITDRWRQQQEIKRVNKQLKSLLHNIPDVVFRCKVDKSWTMLYMNQAIKKLTGYEPDDFIMNRMRSFKSIVHPDDSKMVAEKMLSSLKHSNTYQVEYRILNSIGDILWIYESGTKLSDENNEEYIEGVITDITLNKKMMLKVQKFMDLQTNIVILTNGFKLEFANQSFLNFFGYDSIASFLEVYKCICERFVTHKSFFHLGQVKEDEVHWIESLLNLSGRQRIVSMIDKNNDAHAFTVSINDYETDNYIISFTDISDSFIEKLELQNQAHYDQLTKVFNRTYFDQFIDKFIQQNMDSQHLTGLLMLDIDKFKDVNDTYGHDVGDVVLVELASYIQSLIRKGDILIRWGGEEFIIVFPIDGKENAMSFSENIRKSIDEKTFEFVKNITCSFGVTIYKDNEDILNCIKRADTALYNAKKSGRNRTDTLFN